jgi:hypothetical protein
VNAFVNDTKKNMKEMRKQAIMIRNDRLHGQFCLDLVCRLVFVSGYWLQQQERKLFLSVW